MPPHTAFHHIPHTPRNHFALWYFAATYTLLADLHMLAGEAGLRAWFDPYPFLHQYLDEMAAFMPDDLTWEAGHRWWQRELAVWSANSPTPLPLQRLAEHPAWDNATLLALAFLGLPEEDSRFGILFACVQGSPALRRPTVETIGRALAPTTTDGGWTLCRPIVEAGLADITNADDPRAEWMLRPTPWLWDILRGEPPEPEHEWLIWHPAETFSPPDALILPERAHAMVANLRTMLAETPLLTIVVRGMPGSERLSLLGALAREQGFGVAVTDAATLDKPRRRQLATFCRLQHAWPILRADLPPGERLRLDTLSGHTAPIGLIVGTVGGIEGELLARSVGVHLPPLHAEERRQCWQQALGETPVDNLDHIVERFHLPGGYIRRIAPLARHQAALHGRNTITPADVQVACRTLNREVLDTQATRLDTLGTWEHLVVTESTRERLQELEQRCRHREQVLAHLAPVYAGSNRGVRALFSGASGTGKTFAARILAAELGMDIYRVDLSAIVNKYIGETEKNLHRIFTHAEALDVILLLDEGDALLDKRTDVTNANDRYANLETNLLLQRMETFGGIVIVTTNVADQIDTAFQRRMDVVVHFIPPDAVARLRIWALHLPENHHVSDAYLHRVATACVLTGGQIRNVALNATLAALDDNTPVCERHLAHALAAEYRKAGGICPLDETGEARTTIGVEAFMHTLGHRNGNGHD